MNVTQAPAPDPAPAVDTNPGRDETRPVEEGEDPRRNKYQTGGSTGVQVDGAIRTNPVLEHARKSFLIHQGHEVVRQEVSMQLLLSREETVCLAFGRT